MRRLGILALSVLFVACLSTNLRAQVGRPPSRGIQPMQGGGGGQSHTPWTVWSDPTGSYPTTMDQYPLLKFFWCDDATLAPDTRYIKVNGTTRTTSFTYEEEDPSGSCEARASSQTTSVALDVGSNQVEMYICDEDDLGPYCWYGVQYVTRLAGPIPVVSLAPYSAALQDLGRCAFDCFAATYAQSTVPYYSLDTPRSITLAYHGDRVDPKPFVQVDVTHGGDASNLPTAYRLKIRKGATDITFLNGETTLRFTTSTATERLAGQFDAAANGMSADSVYDLTVIVGAEYSAGVAEVFTTTTLIVVNENDSPIAKGWMLAGVQRLIPTAYGALLTDGTGSAVYFTGSGTTYYAPAGEFTRLTASGSGTSRTYVRAYPDSTKVTFNYLGRMTQAQDPFGNTTSLSYDASNRLQYVTDPVGKSIMLTYDANGLDYVTDMTGRWTNVTVNSSRLLTAIADPDLVSTQFGYDASQRLSTITNRGGATTTLGYHSTSGKLTSITAPTVTLYTGQQAQPATALAPWQLVSAPYTSTSSTPFTAARADTVRAAVTDPGSHAVRFTVNSFGQPLQTAGPLGDTVTVTYNPAGQPLTVTDRLGVNASSTYDGSGFPTAATVAGVTTYARNGGWGQADSTWGAGVAQRTFLGQHGRVDSTRVDGSNNGGYTTRYYFNSRGRVTSVYSSTWQLEVAHGYNGILECLWVDTIPGGRVKWQECDGYGRHPYEQSPGMPLRAWTFQNSTNRPTEYDDGVNASHTVYAYDSLRLRSVTDPKGQAWYFNYNALGWLTSRIDPAGQRDSFAYDVEGQVRRVINRRGQAIELAYDALHRQVTRTGSAIASDTMSYSSDGRVITVSNSVTQETSYLNNRLQSDSVRTVYRSAGNATYTRRYWHRSVDGLLDSVTASGPAGALATRAYTYRPQRGTLESISLGSFGTTTLIPNGELLPAKTRFPTGDSLMRGFVTANDLERVTLADPPLLDEMYHRDPLGRLDQARRQDNGTRAFAYDSLGHLRRIQFGTSAYQSCVENADLGFQCTETVDSTTRNTYDAVGNRDSMVTASVTLTGNYGTGHRIQSFAGCTYTTDADGNVTGRSCPGQSTIFFWSADGRLTGDSVSGSPGTRFSYAYDAAGRVVRRDVNGSPSSYFLWDGDNLLAELSANAQGVVAQYSYYPGLDQLHALIVSDTAHYAQQDAEGNVRFLGTSTYNGRRAYTYDEWGQLTGGWDIGGFNGLDRARWKGALYVAPEADLYYMRARWYEPRTGRFLSEDPVGLAGGLNPYTLGSADPINLADPTGTYPCRPVQKTRFVPDPSDPDGHLGGRIVSHTEWEECGEDVSGDRFWGLTAERLCGYNMSPNCVPWDYASVPTPPRSGPSCNVLAAEAAASGAIDVAAFVILPLRASRLAGRAAEKFLVARALSRDGVRVLARERGLEGVALQGAARLAHRNGNLSHGANAGVHFGMAMEARESWLETAAVTLVPLYGTLKLASRWYEQCGR